MSPRARYLALCALTAISFVTIGRAPRLTVIGARDLLPAFALPASGDI